MLVWRDPQEVTFQNPVVTLGFFDGVHCGHTQLLSQLRALGQELGRPTLAISLWPHPRIVLRHDARQFKLLNTLEYKSELMEQIGIDALLVLNFTPALASLSPIDFLESLYETLHPVAILMGYDHRFGHKGEGDFTLLKQFAESKGILAYRGEPLAVDGVTVSSTLIRSTLLDGDIERATRFLGRDYGFWGTVVHGQHLGRTMGFPTANIQPLSGWQLIPSHGVYAGHCLIPSLSATRLRNALINVGTRPTVDNQGRLSIEAYIPSLHTSIYNQSIFVSFCHKLRNELKFSTLDVLRQQIAKDLAELQAILPPDDADLH